METTKAKASAVIPPADSFARRHLGPSQAETSAMLKDLGFDSLEALADAAVPANIRMDRPLRLPPALSEAEALRELKAIASKNRVFRSFLGLGYHDCITPPVILRNVFENPGWYTAYTPYQAEIAQGRLEALLNFQTLVKDLTGLEVANASLLDEGTAAAEAMALSFAVRKDPKVRIYFVSSDCHPQTIEVVKTRAKPFGIEILLGDHEEYSGAPKVFGALLQYPRTDGSVCDYRDFCEKIHGCQGLVAVAADLLSLTLLKEPAAFGADIAVGSSQRFGVPLGFGGPHAAYMATRAEFQRRMPGRIVGVSKDASGRPALRLALQTREQHIRREKATSNICTAQVLLAVAASFYAVYHGPEGLTRIALRIHALASALAEGLRRLGVKVAEQPFFDTVRADLGPGQAAKVLAKARARGINLRALDDSSLTVALDETVSEGDILDLLEIFGGSSSGVDLAELSAVDGLGKEFRRETPFLTHPVFNSHHSETEMMRYIRRLEEKDLALNFSMIPLGSCTMKLNAASEMLAITWPEFCRMHPFAPADQTEGYEELFAQLQGWLAEIAGLPAVSLQPNAGSQGEYSGLLVIRRYHEKRGQGRRHVCLIPDSAHGTNPASASLAGMKIVPIRSLASGDIDIKDLEAKAKEHADDLAALMVTYPSTHGVFEEGIRDICAVIHKHGGQVYMDGANLNAQLGLCRPGDMGADVVHINLHKTFAVPHGGGGPGMGPIAVANHLAPYLPGHPLVKTGGLDAIGPVAAAPWGSPSILPISWSFIAQMGADGLTAASRTAILNANYVAKRLEGHYPVLFRGKGGLVAHECILDLRGLKTAGIQVEDVAKRLIDYGFHAPTVSWPVPGTMMVEPTESEDKEELDRFCSALIMIRGEVREIEEGKADKTDNVLKNAPHTAEAVTADGWTRPYSREKAAYPAPWLRENKFWPSVGRIDNAYGDRNFCCALSSPGEV